MRLVTWNVNSLKARLPRVLELLALHEPDVVCLQETKVAGDAFPEAELRDAGYAAVHHSAGRWAGVALLHRDGLEATDAAYGLPGEVEADEARWVQATIGGLRIASVYVPNGRALDSPEYPKKLTFLDAMLAGAGTVDAILGDFNVAPADVDVYDPAAFVGGTHVSADERARVRALEAAGLGDAYRAVHPDEVGYTWWDYRQGHFHRKLGLRIDLVLLRSPWLERVSACGIDRDFRKGAKPSDHAPLLVELDGA